MTINILSPYRVFFIDETEKMWAVLKDGRVRVVGTPLSFANISALRQDLCGVEFDGEHTIVLKMPFGFSGQEPKKLFRIFGYCYYPTLFEAKHPKIALLKADLLNKVGTADLVVYQRARIRFHPQFKLSARIVPPVWDVCSHWLYYITAKGVLARTDGKMGEKITQFADLFCLSRQGSQLAYYDGENIYIISLETGQTKKIMAFNVTALGFGSREDELYFATSNGESHIIQTYNKQSEEIELIVRSAAAIKMIL